MPKTSRDKQRHDKEKAPVKPGLQTADKVLAFGEEF
jgi:hypothetical protein